MQTLPAATESYQRSQQRITAEAVVGVRAAWRMMGAEFDSSYAAVAPLLLTTVEAASARVVEGAMGYVPDVLEETGQARFLAPAGEVVPGAFAGVDGSGRPSAGLYGNAPIIAKQAVARGATTQQALSETGKWLVTATATLLADVARAVETTQMGNHRVGGYVRALSLPSCSRCAILAGRWYADSVAFQRHPRCDCRHVPVSEAFADEFVLDSRQYFDSLSSEDQDRIFTKAGAEAIREGADLNQVVNARRGMKQAQVGGRSILTTSEGVTRRGYAYQFLSPSRASDVRDRGARYARANRPRLMPETIREIATDREDYLRLLKANGFIR